ncbi:6-phosphogluconolactonase [Methyloligella sp. 2.7D]|uniref:6-phosphogluconolactonase n=1 Tax=unclassified Methyloligella TaxID=2625955 RepID=UPI00157D9658|nr:6-phosphogluconolactonase [Methyloligella sp. GL2]QKP76933.1 6-phosphogluconolactonase [Methyloligella sp. GL2]
MTLSLPRGTQLLPDPEAVARAAADHLLVICATATQEKIAICLAGGSTPKRLYQLLGSTDYRHRLPWERIHWFFGDERLVPLDDSRSNAGMAHAAFDDAPIPPANFHVIPTGEGAETGAAAYDRTLREFHGPGGFTGGYPLFDLVLLGLGGDGHTASLFPGTAALNEDKALATPVPEPGLEPFVPRITLTYPALGSARLVLFLITGAGKTEALRRLAAGEDLPAGKVASKGQLWWLIDAAAAGGGTRP